MAASAAHKLGWTWYQMKKFPEAEAAFTQQAAMKGNSDELRVTAELMAAECLYQQKLFDRAHTGFDAALKNSDKATDALRSLCLMHAGQCAGQQKKWEASVQLLNQYIDEYPEGHSINEARYELAWAHQNLGGAQGLAKATSLYEQVAADSDAPVGARARFMLGELQFSQKDYDQAIRSFAKVFAGYGGKSAPKPYHQWQADSLFEAARCCESSKRLESAKRFYQQLVDDYPESDKVPVAKARLSKL